MTQPGLNARKEYLSLVENGKTEVTIPRTRRRVRVGWLHPYTMERLTRVWIEREDFSQAVKDGQSVAADLCKEPYFAFKEAALILLNNDIKIRLFYPFLWRWLAFRYDEGQMVPIVAAGKKKVPLTAHYETMAYSLDMRTDMMEMTKREAEQYRAGLLSAAREHSSRSGRSTEGAGGGSSGGSGTSATAAV